ncbi:hypothetical protein MRB53_037941 [Persea americana]|nr:hypothetical protein MRB53_037941 [Persea americana]
MPESSPCISHSFDTRQHWSQALSMSRSAWTVLKQVTMQRSHPFAGLSARPCWRDAAGSHAQIQRIMPKSAAVSISTTCRTSYETLSIEDISKQKAAIAICSKLIARQTLRKSSTPCAAIARRSRRVHPHISVGRSGHIDLIETYQYFLDSCKAAILADSKGKRPRRSVGRSSDARSDSTAQQRGSQATQHSQDHATIALAAQGAIPAGATYPQQTYQDYATPEQSFYGSPDISYPGAHPFDRLDASAGAAFASSPAQQLQVGHHGHLVPTSPTPSTSSKRRRQPEQSHTLERLEPTPRTFPLNLPYRGGRIQPALAPATARLQGSNAATYPPQPSFPGQGFGYGQPFMTTSYMYLPASGYTHDNVVGQPGMPAPRARIEAKARFVSEDDALLKILKEEKKLSWRQIEDFFPGRKSGTLQVRYCTKVKAKEGKEWDNVTEQKLKDLVKEYEDNKWKYVSSKMPSGFPPDHCKARMSELIESDLLAADDRAREEAEQRAHMAAAGPSTPVGRGRR